MFLIYSFGIATPARAPPHVINRKLLHHKTNGFWRKENCILTLELQGKITRIPA
ncbi:hypothetical protein M419DRAFT_119820 [Trichoderma reesei RUT C-30]|uniref:Uncharacterized protein n=1 Tax=Hypocrea jecorina (strain ATCC 56765 / BCRC 32924 / NRRL 11460 / Rut C-30) TaxID=1344414 RepID=A0A024S7G5_HYPJR|nr:hypothetical protein M419DRAFT_119820 [Trichoderma reesei RUT C-30]